MLSVRSLATVVLGFAVVVLVTSLLPYTGFIPRRSLWSMVTGATLLSASAIELSLVLVLAYRLSKARAARSPVAATALVAGTAASVPVVWVAFALARPHAA
jgi:hypothetical protein